VLTAIQSKTYANELILLEDFGQKDVDEIEKNVEYKLKEQPKPKQKPVKDLSNIIEKPDDEPIIESLIAPDDPDKPIDLNQIEELPEEPDFNPEDAVPFIAVEIAPLYPGCKGDSDELKECFSKQIGKFIQRRFDGDLAQTLGLSPGVKRIFVLFEVDAEGNITNIQARAPHKRLQEEAISIVEKLPKMSPGKQQGRPVPVRFSIPIAFRVE
jgi:protein TonB